MVLRRAFGEGVTETAIYPTRYNTGQSLTGAWLPFLQCSEVMRR
jgi:hypothetical protein